MTDTWHRKRPDTIRRKLVLGLLALATVGIVVRAVQLQVFHSSFLQRQGEVRHMRQVEIPAQRGMIVDRNGEPLAVSSPVESVWAQPMELAQALEQLPQLADILQLNAGKLKAKIIDQAAREREFAYLKRHLEPVVAAKVRALEIPGVYIEREYRRYYPDAEITANLLGFTNIDDLGQEGLELTFDAHLRGTPGQKRVIKDRLKRVVEGIETLRAPQPGKDLVLSIDRRIQYHAYRALKTAVQKHSASTASAVVLDPHTGEILAMVNQPASNPNSRKRQAKLLRNHAVTDVFEPGSTMKPFSVALALEHGLLDPHSPIDTRPGYIRYGRNVVRDIHNYGLIDVSRVITKSSNVGISKIALSLPPEKLWGLYHDLGVGRSSGLHLAGEQSGVLSSPKRWSEFVHATNAFGYGLSTNTLQLAQAYAALAADGVQRPLSLLRLDQPPREQKRLLSARTARQVRAMMETVVSREGTARRAAVSGYRVAGKTGTVHKVINGRYSDDHYYSLFAGFAPVDNPRLVMVIVVDDPKGRAYYGGLVAAPVFSAAMSAALRLLDVPPDAVPEQNMLVATAEK